MKIHFYSDRGDHLITDYPADADVFTIEADFVNWVRSFNGFFSDCAWRKENDADNPISD